MADAWEHAETHLRAYRIARRQLLRGAVGGAVAFGLGAGLPSLALADDHVTTVAPKPIPGGVSPFGIFIHHFPPVPVLGPTPINEPSQITDFNGFVGITRVLGTGTGINTQTGARTRLNFQVDNGFMDGVYVGEDGKQHNGTFAFV
ncbi:MAG: hypothetical protein ACTHMJ_05740 [Thermomicrobiales bacterium]|nr:hypothetical protein [Thermomicrobiales bacterium]